MSTTPLTLSFAGQQPPIALPQVPGTRGPVGVDMRGLNQSGFCSYDPGFANTAGCQSAISWIDTENSVLLHRGYPVDQLARQCDFLEVAYIMLNGDAPDEASYQTFRETITRHTLVHEQIARMCSGFRRDSHPMALMCALVGALAAFYHDVLDVENPQHRALAATRLLSKMPTIAAMSYKYTIEQPAAYPRNDLSYAGNFLNMMFSTPCEPYEVNPILERAMDRILILHADHEQNASTSTVRTAGSSGANPFACIAAGIASLWGPAHGGANEAALKMLEEISSVKHIPEFVRRAKDKNDSFRLMGFGHRVYKNYDPRATVMRETCHEVLKELGTKDDLLEVAMELENIALNDPYFIEKKLYPNVDFYSGIILKAMGIPSSMFTVIFAMARTVGWIAHWSEMHSDGMKIARPRQLYTGYEKRDFKSDIKR